MLQKTFLSLVAVVFLALLLVQGYFATDENIVKEMQAKRIGAELVDKNAVAKTGEDMGGLSVYLTIETKSGEASDGIFTVNGIEAGNFRRGVLTLSLREGDILGVKNAVGESFCILDYPADLDSKLLPSTLFCDQTVTKWGKISFK